MLLTEHAKHTGLTVLTREQINDPHRTRHLQLPRADALNGSYLSLESDIRLYTLILEKSCSQHQLSYCCRNTISASDFQLAWEDWPLSRLLFSFPTRSCLLRGSWAPPTPLSINSVTSIAFVDFRLALSSPPGCRGLIAGAWELSYRQDPSRTHASQVAHA